MKISLNPAFRILKVLLKELQSLALDIRVLREDQTEVEIKECIEDVDDLNVNIDGYEEERIPSAS